MCKCVSKFPSTYRISLNERLSWIEARQKSYHCWIDAGSGITTQGFNAGPHCSTPDGIVAGFDLTPVKFWELSEYSPGLINQQNTMLKVFKKIFSIIIQIFLVIVYSKLTFSLRFTLTLWPPVSVSWLTTRQSISGLCMVGPYGSVIGTTSHSTRGRMSDRKSCRSAILSDVVCTSSNNTLSEIHTTGSYQQCTP